MEIAKEWTTCYFKLKMLHTHIHFETFFLDGMKFKCTQVTTARLGECLHCTNTMSTYTILM